MRTSILLAGIVATTIGLGAVSTGSAFAAGCLAPEVATPPVSLSHNDMGDKGTNFAGASSKGFGYDRDAYLAALAKGNSCGVDQQSQPVSDTHIKTNQPVYNNN